MVHDRTLTFLLLILPLGTLGATDEATPPSWQQPPVVPIDQRIDPDRITETPLPPLPNTIHAPMPPSFRIAMEAGDAPVDEDTWIRTVAAIDRGLDFMRTRQEAAAAAGKGKGGKGDGKGGKGGRVAGKR